MKIESALHDPSFPEQPSLFRAAVVQSAIRRGLLTLREAPNGSLWLCDKKGQIYHGLV